MKLRPDVRTNVNNLLKSITDHIALLTSFLTKNEEWTKEKDILHLEMLQYSKLYDEINYHIEEFERS